MNGMNDEWNQIEWNRMNGMNYGMESSNEWNGMEWNGMEWNESMIYGMNIESNGIESLKME